MSSKHPNMAWAAAKLAVRLLGERLQRPEPRTLADVPRSVRRITPQWMTQVMCKDVPGAQVTEVKIIAGTLGTHERNRMALTYNAAGTAAGLPPSVFIKSLPSLVTRMLVGFMGHARYEMLFYTRIRPRLDIETPLCYHSASDKTSYAAVHVLEDLAASKNASFGDETTLLTREQAEDMVDLLADLHGGFYESPALRTDFRWLVDYATWFEKGIERVGFDRYSAQAIAKARHVIPPALFARRDEIWPATMKALDVHRKGPLTVIHSDVHIGNWYRTGEGRVGLFDWQCVARGHWSRDLAYALSSCLPIENRRAWERELVRRYVDRLQQRTGVQLDWDDCWNHYRQQTLHALVMWTQTLCHPIFQPNSQRDELTYELMRRITTAIADLDVLDSFAPPVKAPATMLRRELHASQS